MPPIVYDISIGITGTVSRLGRYNIGRDCRFTVIGPFGQPLSAKIAKAEVARTYSDRISALLDAPFLISWQLTFVIDRAGAEIDDLFCAIESSPDRDALKFKVMQQIEEIDGTVS